MVDLPSWGPPYVAAEVLRAEVDAMRASIAEAILSVVGENEVVSILAHGSSLKEWDTPIDYVPELSDVDVHLVLRDPGVLENDIERSLAVQVEYERLFAERVPNPAHLPRPQIMIINGRLESPEFLSGPPGTTVTLFGTAQYDVRPQPDPDFVAQIDLKTLLADTNAPWIAKLPDHVMDRPGKFLWQPLRDLSWRVAPTAPRVLGAGFEEAWGQNRTGLVRGLRARSQDAFADSYVSFYLEGWNFFLSGYRDADAARRGLLAGRDVLIRAVDIARGD